VKSSNYAVYIVESPHSDDFLAGRAEGRTLSQILDLGGILNQYRLAINRDALHKAIELSVHDVKLRRSETQKRWIPILHISCHGDASGLELSNGDRVEWSELGELLKLFYDQKIAADFAVLYLSMSACEGIHAFRADVENGKSPFVSIVGPLTEVGWAEALVAYSVYYYNLILGRLRTPPPLAVVMS